MDFSKIFSGEKAHQIDDKNRIRIPSCFRDKLGSDYVMGEGFIPGTIDIYPRETIDKKLIALFDKVINDSFDPEQHKLVSEFSANYKQVSEDSQGRVVIPEDVLKVVTLEKDVVTIGAIDHLVLMSASMRTKQKENKSFASTVKDLNTLMKKKEQEKNV